VVSPNDALLTLADGIGRRTFFVVFLGAQDREIECGNVDSPYLVPRFGGALGWA